MDTNQAKNYQSDKMKIYKPVIVVVAYNRPASLERLLNSLLKAQNADGARLVISIDNDAPNNYPVRDVAQAFYWPYGEKEVIYQQEHMGLRRHILKCGDMSEQYGSVIILEDDLLVSPFFYDYAVKSLEYYGEDPEIGGISLYDQPVNEILRYPFRPLRDESDVYFMQFPSSYGQAWTQKHWKEFRKWYNGDPDLTEIRMSRFIAERWPESSWKKYFCGFLVAQKKFFVFPRISLTTNFNDPGANLIRKINHNGQAQLRLTAESYNFRKISESICIYDSYLEIASDTVKKFNSGLSDYDFEMDLYATKETEKIASSYVITSRPSANPIKSYRRALKPHEMNIIFDLDGDELVLCKKEDILPPGNKYSKTISDYSYFYTHNLLGWKALLNRYTERALTKIRF